MATREGLVAMLATSGTRWVAPLGGRKRALGTNPIAFGLPTAGYPLILDMGTSAFMASELMFLRRLGDLLPEGVAIDSEGEPSRDPAAVMQGGALLPFGGHKGYGLALVIQALGLLDGSTDVDDPQRSGYLLQLFKPELLVPAEQYRRTVSALLDRVKSTPRQPGMNEIRIPSERGFRERERLSREGITIDRTIEKALLELVRRGGDLTRG
jgi:LDH2 family malate/lactate/ureidoglycolate dehydrogenase